MLPGPLIASYRKADYQIGTGPGSITLRIDQHSEPLAHYLNATNHRCAAIVSAYNPRSCLLSEEENQAAHKSLEHFLKHYAYPATESLNKDPEGAWPPEKSFFIPGMDLATAKRLGRQFNQNAIVWIDSGAIPRLILLC